MRQVINKTFKRQMKTSPIIAKMSTVKVSTNYKIDQLKNAVSRHHVYC